MIKNNFQEQKNIILETSTCDPLKYKMGKSIRIESMRMGKSIRIQRAITMLLLVCLFDLILYVPSTIFQLNRDGSSWVEPVLS